MLTQSVMATDRWHDNDVLTWRLRFVVFPSTAFRLPNQHSACNHSREHFGTCCCFADEHWYYTHDKIIYMCVHTLMCGVRACACIYHDILTIKAEYMNKRLHLQAYFFEGLLWIHQSQSELTPETAIIFEMIIIAHSSLHFLLLFKFCLMEAVLPKVRFFCCTIQTKLKGLKTNNSFSKN